RPGVGDFPAVNPDAPVALETHGGLAAFGGLELAGPSDSELVLELRRDRRRSWPVSPDIAVETDHHTLAHLGVSEILALEAAAAPRQELLLELFHSRHQIIRRRKVLGGNRAALLDVFARPDEAGAEVVFVVLAQLNHDGDGLGCIELEPLGLARFVRTEAISINLDAG